jgi:hypothetical protein
VAEPPAYRPARAAMGWSLSSLGLALISPAGPQPGTGVLAKTYSRVCAISADARSATQGALAHIRYK